MVNSSSNTPSISQLIKAEALKLGFTACGIARADRVDETAEQAFRQWTDMGYCATMDYMRNNTEMRLDPRLLLPGAKSVISLALNYYPTLLIDADKPQFAFYAYGRDYHKVMRNMMQELTTRLKSVFSEPLRPFLPADDKIHTAKENALSGEENDTDCISFKLCCDTVPILDRYWAWRSGLGWIGKNGNLIIPHAGSYFFLGEIVLTKELDYDSPVESMCGNCTRCIDACPTKALCKPFVVDARRCLSFHTIESRADSIPDDIACHMPPYIYGCDRCQLACPHNRFATPTGVMEFAPSAEFLSMGPDSWLNITEDDFRRIFKGSAVVRAKHQGFARNARALHKHSV